MIAWILGQRGETRVAMSGWIAEHYEDGADVTHLILHPLAAGVADKMRQLAHAFGLAQAITGQMPEVPPDTCWATIADSEHGRAIWLHHGQDAWIHRPIDDYWEQVLRTRGYTALWIGMDATTDLTTERRVDRYLTHTHRLYGGLIRVADL